MKEKPTLLEKVLSTLNNDELLGGLGTPSLPRGEGEEIPPNALGAG